MAASSSAMLLLVERPAPPEPADQAPLATAAATIKSEFEPRLRVTLLNVVDSLNFDIDDISQFFKNSLVTADPRFIEVTDTFNRTRNRLFIHTANLAIFAKLQRPDSKHRVICSTAQLKYKKSLQRRLQQRRHHRSRRPEEFSDRRTHTNAPTGPTAPPRTSPPPTGRRTRRLLRRRP